MTPSGFLGKTLIITGAVLLVAGLLLLFADRIPFLGKLPGDLRVERPRFTLHVPLVSSLILSIIIMIILNLIGRK